MKLDSLVSSLFLNNQFSLIRSKEGLSLFFSMGGGPMMSPMMAPAPMMDAPQMCMGYQLPSINESNLYAMDHAVDPSYMSGGGGLGFGETYYESSPNLNAVNEVINSWDTGIDNSVAEFSYGGGSANYGYSTDIGVGQNDLNNLTNVWDAQMGMGGMYDTISHNVDMGFQQDHNHINTMMDIAPVTYGGYQVNESNDYTMEHAVDPSYISGGSGFEFSHLETNPISEITNGWYNDYGMDRHFEAMSEPTYGGHGIQSIQQNPYLDDIIPVIDNMTADLGMQNFTAGIREPLYEPGLKTDSYSPLERMVSDTPEVNFFEQVNDRFNFVESPTIQDFGITESKLDLLSNNYGLENLMGTKNNFEDEFNAYNPVNVYNQHLGIESEISTPQFDSYQNLGLDSSLEDKIDLYQPIDYGFPKIERTFETDFEPDIVQPQDKLFFEDQFKSPAIDSFQDNSLYPKTFIDESTGYSPLESTVLGMENSYDPINNLYTPLQNQGTFGLNEDLTNRWDHGIGIENNNLLGDNYNAYNPTNVFNQYLGVEPEVSTYGFDNNIGLGNSLEDRIDLYQPMGMKRTFENDLGLSIIQPENRFDLQDDLLTHTTLPWETNNYSPLESTVLGMENSYDPINNLYTPLQQKDDIFSFTQQDTPNLLDGYKFDYLHETDFNPLSIKQPWQNESELDLLGTNYGYNIGNDYTPTYQEDLGVGLGFKPKDQFDFLKPHVEQWDRDYKLDNGSLLFNQEPLNGFQQNNELNSLSPLISDWNQQFVPQLEDYTFKIENPLNIFEQKTNNGIDGLIFEHKPLDIYQQNEPDYLSPLTANQQYTPNLLDGYKFDYLPENGFNPLSIKQPWQNEQELDLLGTNYGYNIGGNYMPDYQEDLGVGLGFKPKDQFDFLKPHVEQWDRDFNLGPEYDLWDKPADIFSPTQKDEFSFLDPFVKQWESGLGLEDKLSLLDTGNNAWEQQIKLPTFNVDDDNYWANPFQLTQNYLMNDYSELSPVYSSPTFLLNNEKLGVHVDADPFALETNHLNFGEVNLRHNLSSMGDPTGEPSFLLPSSHYDFLLEDQQVIDKLNRLNEFSLEKFNQQLPIDQKINPEEIKSKLEYLNHVEETYGLKIIPFSGLERDNDMFIDKSLIGDSQRSPNVIKQGFLSKPILDYSDEEIVRMGQVLNGISDYDGLFGSKVGHFQFEDVLDLFKEVGLKTMAFGRLENDPAKEYSEREILTSITKVGSNLLIDEREHLFNHNNTLDERQHEYSPDKLKSELIFLLGHELGHKYALNDFEQIQEEVVSANHGRIFDDLKEEMIQKGFTEEQIEILLPVDNLSKFGLDRFTNRFNSGTYATNELMSDMYGKKYLEYHDSIKGTELAKQYEKSIREHEKIFEREINEELTYLRESAENYTSFKKGQSSKISEFVNFTRIAGSIVRLEVNGHHDLAEKYENKIKSEIDNLQSYTKGGFGGGCYKQPTRNKMWYNFQELKNNLRMCASTFNLDYGREYPTDPLTMTDKELEEFSHAGLPNNPNLTNDGSLFKLDQDSYNRAKNVFHINYALNRILNGMDKPK
jgi:hypothetical protein